MRVAIESKQDRIEAVRVAPDAGCHPRVIVEHDGGGFVEHAIAIAHSLTDAGNVAKAVTLCSRRGQRGEGGKPLQPPRATWRGR